VDLLTWFQVRGLRETNERLQSAYAKQMQHRAMQFRRIQDLEDELGRIRLLTFALADLCLDTGLVTLDEMKERLKKLDVSDGVEDGKLAPGRPLPGSPPEPPPAPPVPVVRRRRFKPRD
jgi:hypothetical protein